MEIAVAQRSIALSLLYPKAADRSMPGTSHGLTQLSKSGFSKPQKQRKYLSKTKGESRHRSGTESPEA
jgi:hypothetical protein